MPFIKFKIFPELEVVLVFYFGDISKDIIDSHLIKLTSDIDYNPNYNVISDLSNSNLLISHSELNEIVKKVSIDKVTVGKRKQAFIFKSATQQALSSLFSMFVRNLPMKISIVESKREAYEWINLDNEYYNFVTNELESFTDS